MDGSPAKFRDQGDGFLFHSRQIVMRPVFDRLLVTIRLASKQFDGWFSPTAALAIIGEDGALEGDRAEPIEGETDCAQKDNA
jgi:hypothetical protein